MMYMVDLSGRDAGGRPRTERFGGLFLTIEAAADHARGAAGSPHLHFHADTLWVRDEANDVVRRENIVA